MGERLKLRLTEPGLLYASDLIPVNPIVRWKVELRDKHVYIIGFNIGRPGQNSWWQITGRKRKHGYKTYIDALAALQYEMDNAKA